MEMKKTHRGCNIELPLTIDSLQGPPSYSLLSIVTLYLDLDQRNGPISSLPLNYRSWQPNPWFSYYTESISSDLTSHQCTLPISFTPM